MAFSTITVQPQPTPAPQKPVDNAAAASFLGALLLSFYAAGQSKKAMRKMKRKLMWTALKAKFKGLFNKKEGISTRTLLIILIAVLALILLLTVSWPVALVLVLAGILVVLLVIF